jgi:hypothetical protein
MRREALRIFESQRGAGQIPYQMLRISRAWEACLAQMLAQRSSMRHKTISALVEHSA